MHTKKELDEKLKAYGVSPLKKLGQNFLLNPKICKAIIENTLNNKPASIVEVGPGLGALTDDLVLSEIPLTLIELDSGLVQYWQKQKNAKVSVIHQDALKLDWKSLVLDQPSHLLSNLPYSIAASLVIELSGQEIFREMTLMFQKEVAERIVADKNHSDYGMLSVMAQSFWEITKLIDAGPQDFYPVPNVGSRVLHFKSQKQNISRDDFLVFVKEAFSQRRKKMIKNLEKTFNKNELAEAFRKLNLSLDIRAQELSPQEFQKLYFILRPH